MVVEKEFILFFRCMFSEHLGSELCEIEIIFYQTSPNKIEFGKITIELL